MDKIPTSTSASAPDESTPLVIPYGFPVDYPPPQPYLLLPLYRPLRRRRRFCCCSSSVVLSSVCFLLLLLLSVALFFLWPSDPDVKLARLNLNHVRVVTNPFPVLDISMDLQIRVRNPNFFALDYDSLVASIAYRGKLLGLVTSGGGRINARQVSYVNARLRLDGIRVVSDVFYLIDDLARGSIPFDTVTEVHGKLLLLSLQIGIEGKISCSVTVDPGNQTVVRHDCHPE